MNTVFLTDTSILHIHVRVSVAVPWKTGGCKFNKAQSSVQFKNVQIIRRRKKGLRLLLIFPSFVFFNFQVYVIVFMASYKVHCFLVFILCIGMILIFDLTIILIYIFINNERHCECYVLKTYLGDCAYVWDTLMNSSYSKTRKENWCLVFAELSIK